VGVVEVNCLAIGIHIDGFINEASRCILVSLNKLIVVSTGLFNSTELSELSKETLQRYFKPLVIALMFILWIIPAPIVNRLDLKVFGIPLLWFYYLALSIAISLTLTLLYVKSRGGNIG